jgi:hypothetical protein
MRIYHSLPALAFAALLSFSAGGAQAGRFFGPDSYGADYRYQYPNPSQNSFDYGPGSYYQAQSPPFRHRLFHRDQGVANDRMPANVMPGYGIPPVHGVPIEYMQTPIVQPPIQTPPIHMTSVAPAPLPVAPAVQNPPCSKCGQSGQAPAPVPAAPAVQSRLVPIATPIRSGPTTAEPPQADPSGKPPS